jgi:hypothetical protein
MEQAPLEEPGFQAGQSANGDTRSAGFHFAA